MTPMSIDYLRFTSRRKSKGTQHVVKDKTGNSIKIMGQTNKHEGMYLISHVCKLRKVDGLFHLTTIEIAKAQKKDHQIYSKKRCKNIRIGSMFLSYWKHNTKG